MLTPAQMVRIRILHGAVPSWLSEDWERTVENFNGDAEPEREIQIFERAQATYFVVCRSEVLSEEQDAACRRVIMDLVLCDVPSKDDYPELNSNLLRYVQDVFAGCDKGAATVRTHSKRDLL